MLALLVASSQTGAPVPPKVGCVQTHEWADLGAKLTDSVAGEIQVEYAAARREPLPKAQFVLAQLEPAIAVYVAESGEDGKFAIPGVPNGHYRFNVCREGFVTLAGSLDLDPGATETQLQLVTRLDW
jgi:hypothetical protein